MDIFCEQLVARKRTAKDTLIIALMICSIFAILVLGYILGVIVNPYMFMVGIFAAAFDVYACWYVITGRSQEFEYAITNNNLTIDKVMAKRRRKSVISINIKDITQMHKIKDKKISDKSVEKIIYAGATEDGPEEYQILVKTEKFGNIIIVFSPNEKVLAAMKNYLPYAVMHDVFK